jgi:hypothetical protein
MKDLDKKRRILNELKWTAISFVAASIVIIFFPFPADLVLALMTFLVLGWYRRYLLLRKLGMKKPTSTIVRFEFKKMRELFKSNISVSNDDSQTKVKYYCMNCGYEHREIACPNCSSKMKRVGL